MKSIPLATAVFAAFAAGHIHAQDISIYLHNTDPFEALDGTFDDGSTIVNRPAGVMNFTPPGVTFEAFCVEPGRDLSYDMPLVYQIQDISKLANYDTVARLVGGYLVSGKTASEAAAFQWAIWEVMGETESTLAVDSGVIRITDTSLDAATITQSANNYLSLVSTYNAASLTYLTNASHQNVVTWTVIPEPSALGLISFSGLFFLRRRRK